MPLKKSFFVLLLALFVFYPRSLSAQGRSTSTGSGKMRDIKATITQKRTELQQRITSVQDQAKQKLVLNINDKIVDINTRFTDRMTSALEKMTTILNNLIGKTQAAKDSGLDVTAVEQAIADAQASLDAAQTEVASQSAKVYTIDATDSATLKNTVGKTVSQLQSDLRSVRTLVVEAKQKISAVIRELAKTGAGKIGIRNKDASASPALIKPVITE